MDGSERERLDGLRDRQAVEPVLENGVHVAIGADPDRQRAGTGGLETRGPVAAAEAKQPQARAVALLGMRAVIELSIRFQS